MHLKTWNTLSSSGQHGFKRGAHSACVLHNDERDIRMVVHGDDFTALDWFWFTVSQHYQPEVRWRLGPEKCDDKEIRVLIRVINWTPEGIKTKLVLHK